MLNQRKQNRELFNDGLASICATEKRNIVSDVGNIRYGLRTVGVNRFYQAKIADVKLDKLISVPINKFIDTKNIMIICGVQYEVKQVQEKYDTVPPSMYVTLSKAIPAYEDRR